MLRVLGRKNSSNVQKVMWAIGELKLAHERVDVGGPFGGTKEPAYLAKNPNGLVPTLEDGEVTLWESNSIVRYLAARYGAGTLEPGELKHRALASQWMDWQLSVLGPAITPVFWGLVRTPKEERDEAAIDAAAAKTTEAIKLLNLRLGSSAFVAGNFFSMGDIPVGVMAFRYRELVRNRPNLPNFERWYGALENREPFRTHVTSIPLT